MNTEINVKKSVAASLARPVGAAGIAVGLALLGGLAIAAPASAVTNPADNPVRIVVKGDDGQTYVDGQDTLPGFDDEACTYIPGAWFDFKNNRVHYADGQSIPWTEWDRASGYQEWLKSNSTSSGSGTNGGSGTGTKTPSKSTSTKTSTGSSSGSTSTKKTSSSGSGSQSSNGSTSASQAEGSTGSTGDSTAKKSEKKKDATPTSTETGTESTTVGTTEELTTEQTTAPAGAAEAAGPQSGSSAPGPLVGLGILGGLAVVGGLAWAASVVFRRRAAANAAGNGDLD